MSPAHPPTSRSHPCPSVPPSCPRLQSIEIRELPDPVPLPHEAVVRVEAVGVCGSDTAYYKVGRIGDYVVDGPIVLGHEVAGEVVEVGAEVTGVRVGDRVAIEPGTPCRSCRRVLRRPLPPLPRPRLPRDAAVRRRPGGADEHRRAQPARHPRRDVLRAGGDGRAAVGRDLGVQAGRAAGRRRRPRHRRRPGGPARGSRRPGARGDLGDRHRRVRLPPRPRGGDGLRLRALRRADRGDLRRAARVLRRTRASSPRGCVGSGRRAGRR